MDVHLTPGDYTKPTSQVLQSLKSSGCLPSPDALQLCLACANITLGKLRHEDGYDHLRHGKDLIGSAKGCALCHVILHAVCRERLLREDVKGTLLIEEEEEVSAIFRRALNYVHDDFSIILKLDRGLIDVCFLPNKEIDTESPIDSSSDNIIAKSVAQLRIFTDDVEHAEEYDIPVGAALSPAVNLEALAVLIGHWLVLCEDHFDCHNSALNGEPPLPTRILDLRGFENGHVFCLLETKSRHGKYVALSHSWGGKLSLTTTKSNIAERLEATSVAVLPKTFLDAVKTTRMLGIDFLWIDSLCIVQDDPEDWKREAAQMQNVYARAYLTIAATRASHSDDGFLGTRRDTRAVRCGAGDAGSCKFYLGPRRRFDDDVDQGPLAKRAWVLQERVLSPRTLHFTSRQVYWECWAFHQGEDLECTGLGVMKNEMFPLVLRPRAATEQEQADMGSVPGRWWYLLGEYTAASLTYQSDKLVAIDALIRLMEQRLKIHNFNGIWTESWMIGILWAAREPGLVWNRRTDTPSWSWASRTGAINHFQLSEYYQHDQTHFEVASGPLLQITLRARLYTLSSDLNIGDLLRSFPPGGPPELDYHSSRYRVLYAKDTSEIGWLVMDKDNGDVVDHTGCFWVLVAAAADSSDQSSDEEAEKPLIDSEGVKWRPHYCILINQANDGRYLRVGAGTVYYSSCLVPTDLVVEIK